MKHVEPETDSDRDFNRLVTELCCGAPEAALWILQCVELATHWDHVQDGDPVDVVRFKEVLLRVLVEWPRNAFYSANARYLAPVMLNAILAWESSDSHQLLRIKAYDVATEIPCAVAWVIGGESLARKWSGAFREWSVKRCLDNDGSQ